MPVFLSKRDPSRCSFVNLAKFCRTRVFIGHLQVTVYWIDSELEEINLSLSLIWLQTSTKWKNHDYNGYLRETLKPNLSGYSSINFLMMVDFPQPLGPDMTIGRSFAGMLFTKTKIKRYYINTKKQHKTLHNKKHYT